MRSQLDGGRRARPATSERVRPGKGACSVSAPENRASDRELVDALRSGRLTAFDVLYRRHAQAVLRSLQDSLVDETAAARLVGDVFATGVARLESLEEPADFGPWLLAIADELARAPLPASRSESFVSLDPSADAVPRTSPAAPDAGPASQTASELRELASMVRVPLTGLSPGEARTASMVAGLGLTPAKAASTLDIDAPAAEEMLERTSSQLRGAVALQVEVQRQQAPACREFERLYAQGLLLAAAQHAEGCPVCRDIAPPSEAGDVKSPTASPPAAQSPMVIVRSGRAQALSMPVRQRLFVGRECGGIAPSHRLIVHDQTVSRNHLEIRLTPEPGSAYVVDTSTNGTWLNGERIPASVPVPLSAGDRLGLGAIELEFDVPAEVVAARTRQRTTVSQVSIAKMIMVVGDIANYSAISQRTPPAELARAIDTLFGELHILLRLQGGTLSNYVGDALFGVWELDQMPDAAALATDFALMATERVRQMAPSLPLASAADEPVSMGWGVVLGEAAVGSIAGAQLTVLGDAVNVAFRLAGLAGRAGRPPVLVTRGIKEMPRGGSIGGAHERLVLKGRSGHESVFGLAGVPVEWMR
jgi:adenylate cyclase